MKISFHNQHYYCGSGSNSRCINSIRCVMNWLWSKISFSKITDVDIQTTTQDVEHDLTTLC